MIKKKLFMLFVGLLVIAIFTGSAEAKVLPRVKKGVKTKIVTTTGISVTPKLRKDRKAIIVYFKNLNAATSVTYNLSYTGSGQPQGVMGTIDTKGKYSLSRELVFGTASSGVYKYDTNVKNVILVITAKLKNGKTQTKRFKIKV